MEKGSCGCLVRIETWSHVITSFKSLDKWCRCRREAKFVLCDSERHREDHRGSYRPEEFGFSELNSPVPECLEWLLLLVQGLQFGEGRSARDSPWFWPQDSGFTKLRRVAYTMLSLGSLWADNSLSFQPGLGETQLRGSLVLGSRNFLVGLPTDRISCFLFLKGKPWKGGGRGRLFPSWMSIPKPGALPGFRHGIHKAVKNNPLTEQKAWERGWPSNIARGWESRARRRNLYSETLGRVLFQKSYAGSGGLRVRETLPPTASCHEECPLVPGRT